MSRLGTDNDGVKARLFQMTFDRSVHGDMSAVFEKNADGSITLVVECWRPAGGTSAEQESDGGGPTESDGR